MTRLSLIVAMAENGVIGRANRLPWHLSADLKRFRALTWGKPLLMGRKTHESIGRPLPGRHNLVLTRDRRYRAEGCIVIHTLDEALVLAAPEPELMVIGGASLYVTLLPRADRIYQTILHRDYPGDAFFPSFDQRAWHVRSEIRIHDDPDFDGVYTFRVLDRIRT